MRTIQRYDRDMDHESLQRWAADAQTVIDEARAEIEQALLRIESLEDELNNIYEWR